MTNCIINFSNRSYEVFTFVLLFNALSIFFGTLKLLTLRHTKDKAATIIHWLDQFHLLSFSLSLSFALALFFCTLCVCVCVMCNVWCVVYARMRACVDHRSNFFFLFFYINKNIQDTVYLFQQNILCVLFCILIKSITRNY